MNGRYETMRAMRGRSRRNRWSRKSLGLAHVRRTDSVANQEGEGEGLIFVGTSDLAGLVRGKAFPEADLEQRTSVGVGLTGSNIMLSAFGPIYATPFGTYGDLKLVPDMSTRTEI